MSKVINEREIRLGDLALRSEEQNDENYYVVEGLPVVFNRKTCLGKSWDGEDIYEVIDRDAFSDCDMGDVVFNVNHGDGNHGVARTRNHTLELNVREDGVHCLVKLSKSNPRCVQVYEDIREGLLDKMSFAFTIQEQSYDKNERCYYVRKIDKLYDVSAVEHPAYEDTYISARRKSELEAVAKREQAVAEELNLRAKSIIDRLNQIK